jgi:hypothetical protein
MADDEETPVMILSPTDMGGIEGAVPLDVTDCGHPCWISPTGMQFLLTHKAKTMCMHCYMRRVVSGEVPPPEMQQPVPGAVEELTAEIGKEAAERAVKNFEEFTRVTYELNQLKRAHEKREGR